MLISFLFLHENICCGYSLEAPRRGASNGYPQHMFSWRNKKNTMWIPPLICSYGLYSVLLPHGNQCSITKTRLFKCIESFTTKKWKCLDENSDIFFLFLLKNIDCGYSLEPPRWGASNEYHNLCFWAEIRKNIYTPVNPSFTIWKWGLRGSKLYRHVFMMHLLNLYSMGLVHRSMSSVHTFTLDYLPVLVKLKV